MSREERRDHDQLRDDFSAAYGDEDGWEHDVLSGRTAAVIRHAGEALPEDTEQGDSDLWQDLCQNQRCVFLWDATRFN